MAQLPLKPYRGEATALPLQPESRVRSTLLVFRKQVPLERLVLEHVGAEEVPHQGDRVLRPVPLVHQHESG